jgi:DNA-binding PadR family transcriptional regulator
VAKTNKTEIALLGMLNLEPMSGYDLRHEIKESIGYFWQESYGQIYPTLKRLHARNLVTKKKARQSKGPTRYVYSITAKGQAELKKWLAAEPEPEPVRVELLLKLFFGVMGKSSDQIRQLESLLAEHRRKLALYESFDQELLQVKNEPSYGYWRSTIRYGQHLSRARIAWCEETLKWLSKKK